MYCDGNYSTYRQVGALLVEERDDTSTVNTRTCTVALLARDSTLLARRPTDTLSTNDGSRLGRAVYTIVPTD